MNTEHSAASSAVWSTSNAPILITGGFGFIGANLAFRLLSENRPVILFDNLSRRGVAKNLQWLEQTFGSRLNIVIADIRDHSAVSEAVSGASAVFHFAAQTAVTTSLVDPSEDFLINANGTLNVLEAVRARSRPIPVIFTSTNKVYGSLPDLDLVSGLTRYTPADPETAARGIDETRPLSFSSPYGCSKGCADQYILDYANTYGLPCVVFRMSCIYGPHQCGTADQGWIAHLITSFIQRQPINIYGDGKQVRDILFIDDLVEAFLSALANIERVAGRAFNIGGGPANTISLIECLRLLTELLGLSPSISNRSWRPGDQRYYVSNTSRFTDATDWQPRVSAANGIERLYRWCLENNYE